MTDRLFNACVLGSLLVHVIGLAVASGVATSHEGRPPVTVPIEVVSVAPPPPPPRHERPAPRPVQQRPARPRPAAARPVERVAEAPPNLLDDNPRPAPQETQAPPPPSSLPRASAPVVGGPAGMGKVFAGGGDLLAAPGPGTVGGVGGPGPGGPGQAARGTDGPVAANSTGLTALARPLGGYQIRPSYPESARRARIEGVTRLRFVVLATGRVGTVTVAESAGNGDLDRAAVEAIKQWHFEPARRGAEAVAVWVTLPVRFELTNP